MEIYSVHLNFILDIVFSFNCPNLTNQFEAFECIIFLNTSGRYNQVYIDFGDLEQRNLTLNDGYTILNKIYDRSGYFTINSFLLNTPLYNTPKVQVTSVYPNIEPTSKS